MDSVSVEDLVFDLQLKVNALELSNHELRKMLQDIAKTRGVTALSVLADVSQENVVPMRSASAKRASEAEVVPGNEVEDLDEQLREEFAQMEAADSDPAPKPAESGEVVPISRSPMMFRTSIVLVV
jgi:hypothetical protein